MHASNIALLVLAASAAAPVFSAPLPEISTSLSPDEERLFKSLLTSRYDDDSSTYFNPGETRDFTPDQLAARDNEDNLVAALLTSRYDDDTSTYFNLGETRDFTPDELAARDNVDNLVAALLTSRDFNADHDHIVHDRSFTPSFLSRDNELQARSKAGDFFKKLGQGFLGVIQTIGGVASHFFRVRDVTPDELATRDDAADFIALLNTPHTRDSDDASNIRFLNALLQSRDVTPAQDDSADVKFLSALLQSRDLTPEQLVALALASRSFDDLD